MPDAAPTFYEQLVSLERAGTAWNSALYAGDTWRPGVGLQITYGVRLESETGLKERNDYATVGFASTSRDSGAAA